jgi:hypothetical protein
MELCRADPDRFFSMVRDSDRRELAGSKPLDALEQALDAIGTDNAGKIETTTGCNAGYGRADDGTGR